MLPPLLRLQPHPGTGAAVAFEVLLRKSLTCRVTLSVGGTRLLNPRTAAARSPGPVARRGGGVASGVACSKVWAGGVCVDPSRT